MNIFFDLDDTLLQDPYKSNVTVYPMAQKMVKYIQTTDHKLHVLTTSPKIRAINLVNKYYPNTFKTITAREDFIFYETLPYSNGKWDIFKCIKETNAVLVDNDIESGIFRSNGLSSTLKIKYLGIDDERCFRYNNYEKDLLKMFKKFIKETNANQKTNNQRTK